VAGAVLEDRIGGTALRTLAHSIGADPGSRMVPAAAAKQSSSIIHSAKAACNPMALGIESVNCETTL